MIVTEHQAELIRQSFAPVAALGHDAGRLFYRRLFETAPSVRDMFPVNIDAQAGKLVQVLALVVQNISRFEAIAPAVEQLARRHVDYGVQHEHYGIVGLVLIAVLAEALGDAFTGEVEEAWITAYAALSSHMIAVSYPEAA